MASTPPTEIVNLIGKKDRTVYGPFPISDLILLLRLSASLVKRQYCVYLFSMSNLRL
jgi:hypothetical protein